MQAETNRTGEGETKHIHIIEMKHSCLLKTKQKNRNGSFKHFPVKKISLNLHPPVKCFDFRNASFSAGKKCAAKKCLPALIARYKQYSIDCNVF